MRTAFHLSQFKAVILGAPASGKGTVSSRIANTFDIAHISSGDKLRQHVTNGTDTLYVTRELEETRAYPNIGKESKRNVSFADLGKKVKKYVDSGIFVPDSIMLALISNEIDLVGERNWILDGYPRTLAQAMQLQDLHSPKLAVNIVVPDSVILDRTANRWTHLPSGRVYNIRYNDPQVPIMITQLYICIRKGEKERQKRKVGERKMTAQLTSSLLILTQ